MIYCDIKDLQNESDVEQKLISPLIVGGISMGFGYLLSDYKSKTSIKKLTIDKSDSKKLYRPDFIIFIKGIPVLIIEAKTPAEDLGEGYREARLYANELNARFETGINPCAKVLACNGKEIWYGNSDSAEVSGRLNFNEIVVANENFDKLLDFCCKDSLFRESNTIIEKIRGNKQFHKPIAMLGGNAVREEELGENLFGIALMEEYQNIFNPEAYKDRVEIVKNAYIPSVGIEKQMDPIRKIILATMPPSIKDTTKIEDTSKPREILNKLLGRPRLSSRLLLLVGNVGSGKTTFIDYLREVAITDEIKEKTTWVYIDLNSAPISKDTIYLWVQDQIIDQLRMIHFDINLDSIDELKKLYSKDIKSFEDGEGSLLAGDPREYNKALASLIQSVKADKNKTTKAYTRYLCGEREKTFVLVLDNCDKRDKDTQLLMFEVARWAKEEYQALVFLPLRDVTYDLNRTEPPLDTVIKDMAFRIDPPKLSDVLYRRVAYAMQSSKGELVCKLKNDVPVRIAKNQQEKYLAYMLESLYDSTPLVKKLIDGLSGRDIRRGIEIFIALCKSGHISSEQILKMRASKGKYEIESHVVMRALLRGNKRFYSNNSSYIKNLFQSYPDEEKRPDPFVRIAILKWLEKRKGVRGPSSVKGFHKVSELSSDLQLFGHNEERILSEVVSLLKERCLISEAQIEETLAGADPESIKKDIDNNELIKIASAGIIHLELLVNLAYISACAEDVWFEDQKIAQVIAERLTGKSGAGHLSLHTTLSNSIDLINYLVKYHNKYYPNNENIVDGDFSGLNLNEIRKFLSENIEKFKDNRDKLERDYPIGKELQGEVIIHKNGAGVIVSIGSGARGLVSERYLVRDEKYQPGMLINVKIVSFDKLRCKFILDIKR